MQQDVTVVIKELLRNDSIWLQKKGYICIQGKGKRICSGCTSACNESVLVPYYRSGVYR